jgi:hypothetical protein
MAWATSDRRKEFSASLVALSALVFTGYSNVAFAQSAPPLTIPPAGTVPGPDCGPTAAGSSFYISPGNYAGGAYGNIISSGSNGLTNGPAAGSNTTNNNTALYNVPLYSNIDLYGNLPLYSDPTLGGETALYTNTSLYYNSRIDYRDSRGSDASAANASLPLTCRGSTPPLGSWLLYPSVRLYTIASDNLFLSPTAPIKTIGVGMAPTLTAQWTNGIHTTTIYANVDGEAYTDNAINQYNAETTFTQQYAPLRDLTFTMLGDYTHQTIQSSLTNSIPTPISPPSPTPTRLANGNIQLPNGQIISPSGQILGQTNSALANSGVTLVNPYNQYTGTGTVTKVFNYGIVSLSGSAADTVYQNIQGTGPTAFTSFATTTLTENIALWLGPVFYAYSNGAFSWRTENASADGNSNAYRVVGGLGTRQIGLFQATAYFGYQGSEVQGSGTAGGDVFGGTISYYPTALLSISANVDETINISSQTVTANQALTLPVATPVQVPISSSTRVTSTSLQAVYAISPLWALTGTASYTHTGFIDSNQFEDGWLASVMVSYEMWRNMTLSWQYQFTSIVSNIPLNSTNRNLVTMGATYRF